LNPSCILWHRLSHPSMGIIQFALFLLIQPASHNEIVKVSTHFIQQTLIKRGSFSLGIFGLST
jgi:hypothetical protein